MPPDPHMTSETGQRSPAGRVIAGRYRLGDELGHGGFGVVYAATDELLRREVAMKEVRLPPSISAEEREVLRQRVLREARSAGRLHHPGLVTVFDVLDADDRPWIVMELVDGPSLADVIRHEGPLPRDRVARIGVSLAYALEAAHRSGVVHRDVKPANVLINADGRARLTDFGIALSAGDPTLTRTGILLGSPSYIAPERARGGAGGPGSDIWALGATLFTAVEGGPPYESDSAIATLTAIVDGQRHPFRLAGSLAPILDDLMAANPSARPALAVTRQRLREVSERETPRHLPGPRTTRTAAGCPDQVPAGDTTSRAAGATGRPRADGAGISGWEDGTPDVATPGTTDGPPTVIPGPTAAKVAEETQPQPVAITVPPSAVPPSPVPPSAVPPSRVRRRALIVGLVAALITGAAIGVTAVLTSGSDQVANRAGPARQGSAAANTASPSGGTPGTGPGTTATAVGDDPGLVPLDPRPVTPPTGWQSYSGPSGWSVAYPQGWSKRSSGGTEGIDFVNPETGASLHIDITVAANPSALADWQAHEGNLRMQVTNYQRVKIAPSDQGDGSIQADWEFTYSTGGRTVHVLNRGVVRNGHGYALLWHTPDSRWSTDLPLMWQLFSTFRPGR